MTTSQFRKSARRARWLSTGHGSQRSDFQLVSQIRQTSTVFRRLLRFSHQPLSPRPTR